MIKFTVLIMALLMSSVSFSDQEAGLILAVPKEGYPPYIIVNNDDVSGILFEVLKKSVKPLGLTIQVRYLGEIRSKNMLDRKLIDARMEAPNWVERPERYLWSEPIVAINDKFIFHKNTPNVFEKDASMAGATLSVHIGYGYPTLQSHFENQFIRRADYATEHGMLTSLLKPGDKVLRAAVMDVNVAKWLMREHPKFNQQFIFSNRLVDATPIHFQFANNKKMNRWISEINQRISILKETGEVERIVRSILSTDSQ